MSSIGMALVAKCVAKEDYGKAILAVYMAAKGILPALNY